MGQRAGLAGPVARARRSGCQPCRQHAAGRLGYPATRCVIVGEFTRQRRGRQPATQARHAVSLDEPGGQVFVRIIDAGEAGLCAIALSTDE
ncbi:hypothetical protein Bxe_A2035 [Paraburkholderia xenovorans LB400]|uniref:Uncharacterized protein n=1 Tax=Paraburkholderia xenovorans (strain LB400) TaxID=266265 RepID=Q13YA8_PARXL|nr:hypothetical protein Bxe_A2035 [Paraburkholderia xenovorans LB400]